MQILSFFGSCGKPIRKPQFHQNWLGYTLVTLSSWALGLPHFASNDSTGNYSISIISQLYTSYIPIISPICPHYVPIISPMFPKRAIENDPIPCDYTSWLIGFPTMDLNS